jgi:hypothetical protein
MAVSNPQTNNATRRFGIGVALKWAGATLLGWFCYIVLHVILTALTGGSSLNCLAVFLPLAGGVMGMLQRQVLVSMRLPAAEGWVRRTAFAWAAGIAVGYCLLFLEYLLLYRPMQLGVGFVMVQGDAVNVGVVLLTWLFMGGALGAVQSWTPSLGPAPRAWWTVASALAWCGGAAGNWAILRLYPVPGYQPICIDCVLRIFSAVLVAGAVIALITGLALWNRQLTLALSLAAPLVLVMLAVQSLNRAGEPIFEPAAIRPFRTLVVGEGRIDSPAFSPDGRYLAVGLGRVEGGGSVLVYRTADWTMERTLPVTGHPNGLAYSNNGKRLAVRTAEGPYVIWTTDEWREVNEVWNGVFGGSTDALSFDGELHAAARGERIEVRSFTGGQLLNSIDTPNFRAASVALSADKKLLAASSSLCRVYSLPDGKFVLEPAGAEMNNGVGDLAFSPDGSILAGGRGGDLLLWKVRWPGNPITR